MFISLLKKRDIRQARAILEGRAISGEFEVGFFRALGGVVSAVESGQTFSPVWKLLENPPDGEFLGRLERDILEHLSKPFISEREKGYFTAWLSLIRSVRSP
jgi:hypothetical protein